MSTSTRISVVRGDSFNGNVASWQVKRDGVALDITSYAVRLFVAATEDEDTAILAVTSAGVVGNRVYISSPTTGIIYPDIDADAMAAIAPGSYRYDLEIESPGGEVITVVHKGTFVVRPDIAV